MRKLPFVPHLMEQDSNGRIVSTVTNTDGSWRGLDLIDNGGDAAEAIDEMWKMIDWLARELSPTEPRRAIHQAWLEGYLRPLNNGNAVNPSIASFESFWDGAGQ